MKIILAILLCMFMLSSNAQVKSQYNIKVIQKNKQRTKALFYAVTENALVLLKNNSDTIKISFAKVKDIYINKKRVILPFMLAGGVTFLIAAAQSDLPLEQAAYLVVGVPVGIVIGNLVGQLFANKRYYRKLEPSDFPNIRTDLEKYTQVITTPVLN